MAGVVVALPSPSPATPAGKVATLLLLNLHFVCGVERKGELCLFWEAMVRIRGRTEEIANLNHTLMRGLPSCCQVIGRRVHFSASLPLLEFIKNVFLTNPSLDTSCSVRGGGSLLV